MELTIKSVIKAVANLSNEEKDELLQLLQLGLEHSIRGRGDRLIQHMNSELFSFANDDVETMKDELILYKEIKNYQRNGV